MGDENQNVDGQQPQGGNEDGFIKMTQAELNAKMAEHKRTLRRELEDAKKKASAFDSLQSQVSELLSSGIIDGVEDLEGFRTAASETLNQYKTEQQKAEEERGKLTKALEKASKDANDFKTRYETATIARAIADEAGSKAVNAGAVELIQLKLANQSEVQEDGSVLVNWNVKDEETGKMIAKKIPVKDAIAAMESEPSKYGTLFKSTVSGGSGGDVVDGVRRTAEGAVDLNNMSFEKFLEVQRKNPGLIERSLMG